MEELYLDLKKGNYIKIVGDELEIKGSYVDTWRTFHQNEIIRDKIKNFRLLNFSITFGYNVSIYLVNESKDYFNRMDLTMFPKEAKKYEQLKNIMDQNGVFENRSWFDVNHGKYTFESIQQRLIKEKGENGKPEELIEAEKFYKKISTLPEFDAPEKRKEIEYLRTALHEEEQVFMVVSGSMEIGFGVLVCTDKRVLFIESTMFSGINCTEMRLDKINMVSCDDGISSGSIILRDGAGDKRISCIRKPALELFTKTVHKAMDQQKENDRIVVQNQTSSIADELLKYKQLLDMGAITEEEFAKVKEKLLK